MAISSPAAPRVHFLDDQRRNRRRSRRFAVFAVVAVALAGFPLCVIIGPLLLAGILVVAHVVSLVAPLGADQWAALHDAVFVGQTIFRKVFGRETAISWQALLLIYAAPGAALMLVAWPFVRRLTRRAGVGTILNHLPSREPDPTRLAEQQTVNVVAEMAVAAGIRAPTVRVIDSAAVNAVAVGLSVDDAVLLVTNGFLERLDRDERQAIIAHLIGSVGNGDLEIAATIFSVFETWALTTVVLETPVSRFRRAYVRKFVRLALADLRGRASTEEVRALIDPLVAGIGPDIGELESMLDSFGDEKKAKQPGCLVFLAKGIVLGIRFTVMIAARESANLFTVLVLGPWLAAMWRARRQLADATAVQLTRNPEALASAVRTLAASDVVVPGGWLVHFLFPVWVPVTQASGSDSTSASTNIVGMRLDAEPRLAQLDALGASADATRPVRLMERIRSALWTWEEMATVLGWAVMAAAGVGTLLLLAMAAASVMLMVLWHVLQWAAALITFVGRLLGP